jgi:DNA replication protein DnaC
LALTGSYGAGKTHLAAAIGHYRDDLGDEVTFVSVPDLLDHLRATFSASSSASLDRRFEQVRTSPFLILDDLGTQSSTPWVREKLYQLFNYRYNAELPTVITMSQSLEELDPRLRSRMLDTRLVTIYALLAPPYTGRSANGEAATQGPKKRKPTPK